MTELQISLIVIGAVIIIGVIAYNRWQEYRSSRKVARAFTNAPDDVLMQPPAATEDNDLRREPVFFENTVEGVRLEDPARYSSISVTGLDQALDGGEANRSKEGEMVAPDLNGEAIPEETRNDEDDSVRLTVAHSEPYIDLGEVQQDTAAPLPEEPVKSAQEASSVRPVSGALSVDELIDYPVLLNLENPVNGETILPLIQSLQYVGTKPVHFAGLAKDPVSGEESWQPVVHGGVYLRLKAGVQLANRAGALNEIEYSELIMRLRQMADYINAEPDVPDMADVLKAARDLHQFVAQHDARLVVNVRTGGAPWLVKTLMAVLERQNFDLRPDGVFIMHDTDGSVLFSLVVDMIPVSDTASRLTLLLDVPCVAQEKDGLGMMVRCARLLCERLNGILVDDDDRMLSDPMLDDIAGQVRVFYDEMRSVAIPAGSARAMRLFN